MPDPAPLLDVLYEAALLPEKWPAALAAIAQAGGADRGLLFAASPGFSGWHATSQFEATARRFFEEDWLTRNTRTPILLARQQPGFLRDCDVFTDTELSADPMQRELLVPEGAGREVATSIVLGTGETIVVSLHRPLGRGAFAPAEVEMLDALRPHILRAASVAARLRLERAHVAAGLLQTIGMPAAVLGPGAGVLATNELVESCPHLRAAAFSRLRLQRPADQRWLVDILARIERNGPLPPAAKLSLLLGAAGQAPDSVLHVVPLRGEARDLMAPAIALVVVTALRPRRAPSCDMLTALFSLTASEAKVARALMNLSLDQVAAASNLSRETVRTQLKAVLHKTGTRRQSELLMLLSGLVEVSPPISGRDCGRPAGRR
ncbi:helix-turn-helix transcriptional regulator [Lichenicoccus sp.]|uniref:helix-turn-helix transcriptional regulator n=1 Tax=Lichenicoccus sp. TaxID=2781899 RepID=UPI003D13C1F9